MILRTFPTLKALQNKGKQNFPEGAKLLRSSGALVM